ncbi:hypothetical protein POSPLADRAFT_1046457 [Postia placenta MAD-698-R-SB12]|uniref:Uncharacterized protein n=1 Tax=Postia placenta MAD-698-R-SB12 TaxID=670580 RepID=A0A1X6N0I9_9APHY|nr:hypothetical protein POSPLADRAFT_1046457 [Postia placenta MAD-698-R-SB12]OSX61963.1 hypothetical protein POSPLADRAFT_1046457 [Postia placenta MAD-698-R-SB12]
MPEAYPLRESDRLRSLSVGLSAHGTYPQQALEQDTFHHPRPEQRRQHQKINMYKGFQREQGENREIWTSPPEPDTGHFIGKVTPFTSHRLYPVSACAIIAHQHWTASGVAIIMSLGLRPGGNVPHAAPDTARPYPLPKLQKYTFVIHYLIILSPEPGGGGLQDTWDASLHSHAASPRITKISSQTLVTRRINSTSGRCLRSYLIGVLFDSVD